MAISCALRFGPLPSPAIPRRPRDVSFSTSAHFTDDATGALVEASGVAARVWLPGGALATDVPAPVRVGVGVWRLNYVPAFSGIYTVELSATAPDSAADARRVLVQAIAPDTGTPPAAVPVESVNGKSGGVVLDAGDISHQQPGTGAVGLSLAAIISRRPFHVAEYGAEGDGTDERAEMQNALDACAAEKRGAVMIGSPRYRVGGAGLLVPKGVAIEGDIRNPGELEGRNYTTQSSAILLEGGATIRYQTGSGIRNLAVLRHGMTTPNSVRTGLDHIKAFAGTALRSDLALGDPNGQDAGIENVIILGFDQGIYHDGWPRLDVRNVSIDCTNGLRLRRCYDIGRFENIHYWQYSTTKFAWSYANYAVAGFSDNGSGALRVTLSVPHDLVTGDRANIIVASGAALRARGVVTVISSTVLDFGSVPYSASYVAAGAKVWPDLLYRDGDGYHLTECDGMSFMSCFAFGPRTGFRLGQTFQYSRFTNCKYDNFFDSVPYEATGIVFEGSPAGARGNEFVNWFNGPCGTGVLHDSETLAVNQVHGTINAAIPGALVFDVVNGRIAFMGCETAYTNDAIIRAGADRVIFGGGCDFGTVTVTNLADIDRVSVDGASRFANQFPARSRFGRVLLGESGTANSVELRHSAGGGLQIVNAAGALMGVLTSQGVLLLPSIQLGAISSGTEANITVGTGSPEGVLAGGPGDIRIDVTNGRAYLKRTGTGNSGWLEIQAS